MSNHAQGWRQINYPGSLQESRTPDYYVWLFVGIPGCILGIATIAEAISRFSHLVSLF